MKRILAIDDDPSVTSVLKRGLSYEGFVVEIADSGEEGLKLARERYPDLVILDIMMPGLDGIEVLRRLRAADPQLPVLMLTAKDRSIDQIEGLETGADDYVVKPFSFDVLAARVKAVLRRYETDQPAILRFEDLSLDVGTYLAYRGDREFEVTRTEFDLLRVFLEHPRRVLPRDFLMDRIWGYYFEGGGNVLETYVKQLRQKAEANGEPRLIQTVRGTGYVLRER